MTMTTILTTTSRFEGDEALNEVCWELLTVCGVQMPPDDADFTGSIATPRLVGRQSGIVPKSSLSLRSCGNQVNPAAV